MSNVLFEDGDWRLLQGWQQGIYHRCRDNFNTDKSWWHASSNTKCVFCETAIPDEIQGLWLLYKWDR